MVIINVRVTTMDAELEFAIQSSTTGKQLFDQVVKTVGLREIWYFGLQYTDTKGFLTWLKLNKKVTAQDVKKEQTLLFKFRAKFYPEDVQEEIIQDITLRLFYLQVKDAVLSDEIYCPPETSVLLASFAMQAKYGDYNPESHKPGCLTSDRLLPQRVIGQFKLSPEEWEKRIMVWWADHKNTNREQAMVEYLKIAQDLEMYGVNDFVFYAPRLRINKRILALCMGNHELYMRRRKPDTIEVQQMKQQAKEERMQRQLEQERLTKEMTAREAAEQKQKEYEERMEKMREEMERAQRELLHAQDTIRRLEQQLAELQIAKEQLESKEDELRRLNEQLRSEREMSSEERERLEQEVRRREQQVAEMREQVDMKTQETERLQREVEEARAVQERESSRQMNTFSVKEVDLDENASENGQVATELTARGDENVPQRELERITAAEQNLSLKHKLDALTADLEAVKDKQQLTEYDLLHMENKRAGRDKYKTLRQIRGGNTKRRIDQYENM
uniref:Moesin/ezrin/radixin homolog 1 n=1 Tax=Wuchereria bancrofti TaxID=6293 RepID=A0A1I8ETU4_WUCBA